MTRNKYPQETVDRILDISEKLFMEKGYDDTSIQDILDELGMSKGAVYHHFKSKEEILDKISERYYSNTEWIDAIFEDKSTTGLQKLQGMLLYQLGDEYKVQLESALMPLYDNPRMLAGMMRANAENGVPVMERLIRMGNEDGSLHVEYPRQAAQVLLVLANLWISPMLEKKIADDLPEKLKVCATMLESIGIPMVNEEVARGLQEYERAVTKSK